MGKRRKRLTMAKYAKKYASIRQAIARRRGSEADVVAATTTTTATVAQPTLATPTEEMTLKNVVVENIEELEVEAAPEIEQEEVVTEAKLVATETPTALVDTTSEEEAPKTTKSAKRVTKQAQAKSNKSASKKTISKKPTRKAQKASAKKTSSKSASVRG